MEFITMSKRHGAREQKRLAKRNAKRDAQRRQMARRNSSDPTVRLKDAERWPITACLVPDSLWNMGIGNLIIARRMPDGHLACGVFLVDLFCLGVKDATWKIVSTGEFNELCRHIGEQGQLEDVPPEYFAKLMYRAVDYAQSIGFAPHRDFRHASRLLIGIDPSLCPDEFEFGDDGRPHYVRGPSESLDRARAIAFQVKSHGGEYSIPMGGAGFFDDEYVDESSFVSLDDECEFDEFDDVDFIDDDDDDEGVQPFDRFMLP
jgi:hypothetical protein